MQNRQGFCGPKISLTRQQHFANGRVSSYQGALLIYVAAGGGRRGRHQADPFYPSSYPAPAGAQKQTEQEVAHF